MGFLRSFTHPKDPWWRGPQRWHHVIFLAKTTVLSYFILLTIFHDVVFRFQFNDRGNDERYVDFARQWYLRVGIAIIPDCLYTFFLLLLVHRQTYSVDGLWTMHPVVLLIFSLFLSALCAMQACLHALVYSIKEPAYKKEEWEKVRYAELGFQGAFALFYLGMAGFAGLAVWRWRSEKRGIYVDE